MINISSTQQGNEINVSVEIKGTTLELVHEIAGLLGECHHDYDMRAIFCSAYDLYEEKTDA